MQPLQPPQQHSSGDHTTSRPSSSRRHTQEQRPSPFVFAGSAAAQPAQAAGSLEGEQLQLQQQQQQQQQPNGRLLESILPEDVYMDQIIHKLQLLNYEREFCRRKKPHRKGLTPCYFASPQPGLSGNEQFFYFTSLAVWLLRMCGVTLPTPKEFDDPYTTLQGILQGLRALGFAPPSFAPTKLAPGCGREVCCLLDGLLDVALEARGLVKLPKTVFTQSSSEEGALVEEVGAEDDAADISSQAAAALLLETQHSSSGSSSGGDEPLPGLLRLPTQGTDLGQQRAGEAAGAHAADAAAKQALVSTVDPVAWKLEVERVAHRLRLNSSAAAPDTRDWRQHLEAAHAHMASLSAAWPDVRSQLHSLGGDVAASLDKIDSREQQLSSQCEGLLAAYSDARQQLTAMQEDVGRRTELISERNNELHRTAVALEDAKQQLEARGSNLSDASPLVRLKAAMTSLREELQAMELRIGVVAHNLVSLSLRDKQAALQDAAKRKGSKDAGGGKAGPGAGSALLLRAAK